MRYNDEFDNTGNIPAYRTDKKSNTGLVVAVSILSSIVIIGVVFIALFLSGVISFGDGHDTTLFNEQSKYMTNQSEPTSANNVEEMKPVPVERYMYVGNCKQSVYLRSGANENYSVIREVPLADQVYVVEYANSLFAKVIHNGTSGYIKRDYLVNEKPEVWTYNERDAETQVENSLRAFVNGINTGSTDYVYTYFAGNAVTEEINSHNSIVSGVESEEILSLDCHSVERISASEVTVIRDSVIRVVYNDGKVKDIKEKYKYTLDLSNGMRITKIQSVK